MDISQVIAPKSDQINADDLVGAEMVVTIAGVKVQAGEQQPISISLAGQSKVWRPCKTTARVLAKAWGVDSSKWIGRSAKLFRDETVRWGGLPVGGIRIKEVSDVKAGFAMALSESKAKRNIVQIGVLTMPKAAPVADDPILAAGNAAAARGTDAFRAFWKGIGAIERIKFNADAMAALKATAEAADAANTDPFGLPPLDPMPTPEQIAAAEASALEAIAAQGQE